MVRFIIDNQLSQQITDIQIYIPIWLDLLSIYIQPLDILYIYLHSNMVRFIIREMNDYNIESEAFTFQYG